jgi:hypothetical protein
MTTSLSFPRPRESISEPKRWQAVIFRLMASAWIPNQVWNEKNDTVIPEISNRESMKRSRAKYEKRKKQVIDLTHNVYNILELVFIGNCLILLVV